MEPMAQMEAEMKLRNFSPRTQAEYLRVVRAFSLHFGQRRKSSGQSRCASTCSMCVTGANSARLR